MGEKASPNYFFLLALGFTLAFSFALLSRSCLLRSRRAFRLSESAVDEKYFEASGLKELSTSDESLPRQFFTWLSNSFSSGESKLTSGKAAPVRLSERELPNNRLMPASPRVELD
jgi:hypothetical protein